MSRCDWASDGEQCAFPGTLSDSILGGGRWLCPHHARCDDQATGAEIVARSKRWEAMPNRAEAWVESSRASVYGAESHAVKRLREQMAAHRGGRPAGIASTRLFRDSGQDELDAA